ncbi:MAG: FG-GAP repeat domain-containing protein [Candidatus Hodarchaeota archaeon]
MFRYVSQRSLLIAIALSMFALLMPLNIRNNPEISFNSVHAQDIESHIFVNDTWLSMLDLFSAWGEPRFSLPSASVRFIDTGVITNNEEILVCDAEGFITSYEFQREDRLIRNQDLRVGAGDEEIAFIAEDFNGDGFDDFIVSEGGFDSLSFQNGRVIFHENLGNGSIASPGIVLHNRGFPTTAGDFNGDGNMDLFGLTYESESLVLWNVSDAALGSGNVTWESILNFTAGQQSHSFHTISAADIDNDQRDELLLTAPLSIQEIYIYEFLENESFVRKQNIGHIGHQPYSAFGDLNGDGWLDLVVSDYYANVWYLPNMQNGTLVPRFNGTWLAFGPLAAELAIMDIDNDGRDDLILVTQQYNEVMFFWSSYVPPPTSQAEQSSGLGFNSITTIVIITLPILLWSILVRKLRRNRRKVT